MIRWLAVSLLLALTLSGCGPAAPATSADPAVVTTTNGPVRGAVGDGFRIFQGIPYAAAPTGELRWRPPVAPVPWRSVRS